LSGKWNGMMNMPYLIGAVESLMDDSLELKRAVGRAADSLGAAHGVVNQAQGLAV